MVKSFYSVESLEIEMRAFEDKYGLRSDAFYAAYEAATVPGSVDWFEASVWAGAIEEVCRLRAVRPSPTQFPPVG